MWWAFSLTILSGVIAFFGCKKVDKINKLNKLNFSVVAFLSYVAINTFSQNVVLPHLLNIQGNDRASEEISQTPVLRLLAQKHPEIKDLIEINLKETGKSGIYEILPKYAMLYIPNASDESVIGFFMLTLGIMEKLVDDGDICKSWMFGQKSKAGISASSYISKQDQDDFIKSFEMVISSSISNPQEQPTPEEAQKLMEKLTTKLVEKHGEEFLQTFSLLEDPDASGENENEACFLFIEFYSTILHFEKVEASIVLRSLYATN